MSILTFSNQLEFSDFRENTGCLKIARPDSSRERSCGSRLVLNLIFTIQTTKAL